MLTFLEGKVATDSTIRLVYKDLGAQVSWKTVFLVEYFGPILFSVLLVVFQQQIYGKTAAYTLS